MKQLADIPHPSCKITLFAWNNKYIVKIEQGMLEQTYKVSELEVLGENDVCEMVSEAFLEKVLQRFEAMQTDWEMAMESLED